MPTIGIWVNKEVKEAWDILNKIGDGVATKELKNALYRILQEHKDEIAQYKDAKTEGERMSILLNTLASVSQEDIVSETASV